MTFKVYSRDGCPIALKWSKFYSWQKFSMSYINLTGISVVKNFMNNLAQEVPFLGLSKMTN